jgi:hypothetical protein
MTALDPANRKRRQLRTNGWWRMIPCFGLISGLALMILPATGNTGPALSCADVDLVLAIDGSGSIDAPEFALQQHGYAAAFRRRDVQQALLAAGTVDVAVVLWGDTEMPVQVMPWVRLDGVASAEELAVNLELMTRNVHGNTGLGRALWHALDLLALPGQCGRRKIINVSGDGMETLSPFPRGHIPLQRARERAGVAGVVVNALAIENEAAALADYYENRLIVGAGAFVLKVDGFDGFAEAIARKLIREVLPLDVALLRGVGPGARPSN